MKKFFVVVFQVAKAAKDEFVIGFKEGFYGKKEEPVLHLSKKQVCSLASTIAYKECMGELTYMEAADEARKLSVYATKHGIATVTELLLAIEGGVVSAQEKLGKVSN